jgi:YD repeat-containing protein
VLPKIIQTIRRSRLRYVVASVAFCLSAALAAHAGEGYFGYDEFGRISRSIDEQNRVTDYSYDPAGNIIGIQTNVPALAPTITSLTPDNLRRGESKVIQVVGQNLLSTQISTSDPRLRLSGLQNMQNTDTQMTFTLTAESDAVTGVQQLIFSNNGGTATAGITVNPLLPTGQIAPGPVAVPPDSTPRQFRIQISHADTIAHDFSLSVTDATVATVPATVTIPAGATEAFVTITGLKLGQTAFTFASNAMGTQTQQLYVTNDYQEVYKTYARPVGIVLQEPPALPQTTSLARAWRDHSRTSRAAVTRVRYPRRLSCRWVDTRQSRYQPKSECRVGGRKLCPHRLWCRASERDCSSIRAEHRHYSRRPLDRRRWKIANGERVYRKHRATNAARGAHTSGK